MNPSNYIRQNLKNAAFVWGFLRITAGKTSNTQLSPYDSFALEPTKLQKHSFRLRIPSKYNRHSVKSIAIARGFLRITAPTFKTQLSLKASFELQLQISRNLSFRLKLLSSKTQLSPEASFEIQLQTSRNLSCRLRLPSKYSRQIVKNRAFT
jgi:hypothetical protein